MRLCRDKRRLPLCELDPCISQARAASTWEADQTPVICTAGMEEDALREQVLHQIWMSQFHKLGKRENEFMKLGHSLRGRANICWD